MNSIVDKVYKDVNWLDLKELSKYQTVLFDRLFRFPFMFFQYIDNSQTTMKIYDGRIDVFDKSRKETYKLISYDFNLEEKLIKIPDLPGRKSLAIMDPLIWSIMYRLNMIHFTPKKYLPLSKWFKINDKKGRVISRDDGLHFQFYEGSTGRKFELNYSEFGQFMYRFYRMKLWKTHKKPGRPKGSGREHNPAYFK